MSIAPPVEETDDPGAECTQHGQLVCDCCLRWRQAVRNRPHPAASQLLCERCHLRTIDCAAPNAGEERCEHGFVRDLGTCGACPNFGRKAAPALGAVAGITDLGRAKAVCDHLGAPERLAFFVMAVMSHVRRETIEACAKVCDEYAEAWDPADDEDHGEERRAIQQTAAAIRRLSLHRTGDPR